MDSKKIFSLGFLLITLASSAIIGAALFSQYVLNMHPCGLCLTQRSGHYFAIPLACLGCIASLYAPLKIRKYTIIALILGIGGALSISLYWAGFHIGVEQKWWEGLSTCGGSDTSSLSFEDIMNIAFTPCDRPTIIFEWFFGGLSMATIHAILLIPLLIGVFWMLWRSLTALAQ